MSRTLVAGGVAVVALGVASWAAMTAAGTDTETLRSEVRDIAGREEENASEREVLQGQVDSLRGEIRTMESDLEALRAQVRDLRERGVPTAAATSGSTDGGAGTMKPGQLPSGDEIDASDPANRAEFDRLQELLFTGKASADEQERFWAMAKNPEFLKGLLSDLEGAVEGSPGDTTARMNLARGYITKLFTVPPGPEMGLWATKAEGQWKKVLELDDSHWEARFSLATSWSRYPEFLNKTPDAIAEFKKLRTVQESMTPEPQHAQTYVQLALLHTRQNNREAAEEVLKAGLARHPGDEEIKKTLESLK